jgi:cytochrome c
MKFDFLPNDIPLPLPTGGLEFLNYVFLALLVISWIVHIVFINVLLGSSLGSVYLNYIGNKRGSKAHDKAAYLLTTPVTISENMGALWGVAPLLLVSILYTPLFYAASVMNSPHWLHIIYGNIVAFLLSYLYKFTWHLLEEKHKGLHIFIGFLAMLIFFTLPFVFMATVQLYMTPSTWAQDTGFWDALFRADTIWRLAHFFLATFAVTGVFMLLYGSYKRRNEEDREAGEILIRMGRNWFLIATVLNFFVGPIVMFHFPAYGVEKLFGSYYELLIVVTVLAVLYGGYLLVIDFFNDAMTTGTAWKVTIMMTIAVCSMATLRHGMREALTAPAMAQSKASTEKYVAAVRDFRTQLANAPKVEKAALTGGQALAEKNGCLDCHKPNEKLVGPAYKDIAAKGYSVADIMKLVRTPKPSNWPDYPEMPAMPQVPDGELKQIAEWINSLKK